MSRNRTASYTRHTPDLIIKDTHRGLWYEDGRLTRILEAGRYEYPRRPLFGRTPQIEVVLVDMRERSMTVKDQEILTADQAAIRVSLVARYRVVDPKAAVHNVEDYKARVYADIQLAARRVIAPYTVEDILVSRARLSDDIYKDARRSAASYGVEISRADVRDLDLPASVDQYNPMFQADRLAEAQMLAYTLAEIERVQNQIQAEAQRRQFEAEAEIPRRQTATEQESRRDSSTALAELLQEYPVLMRVGELGALRDLSPLAQLYVHLDTNGKNHRK